MQLEIVANIFLEILNNMNDGEKMGNMNKLLGKKNNLDSGSQITDLHLCQQFIYCLKLLIFFQQEYV